LSPIYLQVDPINGSALFVTDHVKTADPGQNISFAVTSFVVGTSTGTVDGIGLLTPLPNQLGIETFWPTGPSGHYRFTFGYEAPSLLGNAACVGQSNAAAITFSVGKTRSPRLFVVGAAAVLLAVGAAGVGIGLRRHRRGYRPRHPKPPGAPAMMAVLLVGMVVIVHGYAARVGSTVVFDPTKPPGHLGYQSPTEQYDACISSINSFNPGFLGSFGGHVVQVKLTNGYTHSDFGSDGTSTTYWNNSDTAPFKGDENVQADPCSSLYHELVHDRDWADGTYSSATCAATNFIPVDDVVAVYAENVFREAHGLPPRDSYGNMPLPPGNAGCKPPSALDRFLGLFTGDPHITTFDGARYDFQAIGEFTAVTSASGDMTIQIRQAEFGSQDISVNTAVAIKVSGTVLGFYLNDGVIDVWRDGTPLDVHSGTTQLPDGGSLTRTYDPYAADNYEVSWPDGTQANVWRAGNYGLVLTVAPAKSRAGTLSGLLGNFDGNPYNDVAPKGGQPISPSFDALYPAFANSWRISQSESLFDYPPGQSTATFTEANFPRRPLTAPSLPPAVQASARMACTTAGVTNPVDLQACILDVALTGSADFAVAAGQVEAENAPPSPPAPSSSSSPGVTTATASVSVPGTVAHTQFVGKAGQRAFIEVVATTLPDQCGTVALHGPDDNVAALACSEVGSAIEGFLLPSNGVYNVYVDPTGHAVGQITLRIVLSTDQTQRTTIDGPPVNTLIPLSGAQSRVSFTATAGQQVFVAATNATIADQCGALRLEGPDGGQLALGCLSKGTGYIDSVALPVSGTYQVVVDPGGDGIGNVTVRVIEDHNQITAGAVDGPPIYLKVPEPGAQARIVFKGTKGSRIVLMESSSTLPDPCGITSLIGPDGSRFAASCSENNTASTPGTILPSDGTYQVVFDPEGPDTGSVDIKVFQEG